MNTDMNMNDQNLHANLVNAGAQIAMPEEPSAAQAARWKEGASGLEINLQATASPRRRGRMFAMVGAGSLLAASIVLAVIFGEFGGPKRVEAAAIFASLRDAMSHAFSLTLTNIEQDGIHVDGRVLVSLPQEVEGDSDEPGQVYFDLHVEADDGVEDIGGMNADIALGAETGNEWLYIKMSQLPEDMANEPFLAMFAPMAANGVVLDLNGLLVNEGVTPAASIEGHIEGSGENSNGTSGHAAKHTLNLGFSLHGGDGSVAEAVEHHHGGHLKLFAMGGAGHGDSGNGEADEQGDDSNDNGGGSGDDADAGMHGPDFQVVEDFLRGLFEGDLTSEELAAMVSHLEQAAQSVQVDTLENGDFSLIASNFNHMDASLDADEQAMLAELVVEIRYSDGAGVQWLEMRNVGQADGSIRFEMLPDGIDATLLDRTRYTAGGNVMTIPIASFANMFHGHDANDNDGDGDAADTSNPGGGDQ
jgi:hypothetical protein